MPAGSRVAFAVDSVLKVRHSGNSPIATKITFPSAISLDRPALLAA